MDASHQMSLATKWHHRVLGGFWALLALAMFAVLGGYNHWTEVGAWVARLSCVACVVTGIAFIFGRRWAQIVMAVLMIIAALFFLDMVLMFGFHGNRLFMYLMIAGVVV